MSDQSDAFLSALRRCADGVWLTADQVDRIGADLGLSPARCFDLVEEGHRAGRLEINWGGRVMAKAAEPRGANGGITISNSTVSGTVGHGAVGAGAVVADLHVPLGDLAAVLHGLRVLPPGPEAETVAALEAQIKTLMAEIAALKAAPPAEAERKKPGLRQRLEAVRATLAEAAGVREAATKLGLPAARSEERRRAVADGTRSLARGAGAAGLGP